jgi:hypothetical protein
MAGGSFPRRAGGALLALAVAGACAASLGCRRAPATSPVAERFVGELRFPPAELRLRVRALAIPLSGAVEEAADRAAARASSPEVRRAALGFKIDAVPRLHEALLRQDPGLALLDAWALGVQISAWLGEGPGREVFGESAADLAAAGRAIESQTEELADRAIPSEEALRRVRNRVRRLAAERPLGASVAGRRSLADVLARLNRDEDVGILATVGGLAETVGDLQTRLDLANAYVPKMAGWQAGLLLSDAVPRARLEASLDRAESLAEAAGRALERLENAPDFLAAERAAAFEALRTERIAVQEALRADLASALQHLTREREAVAADLDRARVETLAALRGEREAALEDLEAMSRRLGGEAAAGARGLLRSAALPAGIALAVPLLAWVVGVLLILRRLPGAAPPAR